VNIGVVKCLTDREVEEHSKASLAAVDVLQPAVESLVEVVKVILAAAASRPSGSSSFLLSQTLVPSVVLAQSLDNITPSTSQSISKELSAGPDVEVGVSTIAAGGSTALVLGYLHKTLFSTTANSVGVASRLLHSDRCENQW